MAADYYYPVSYTSIYFTILDHLKSEGRRNLVLTAAIIYPAPGVRFPSAAHYNNSKSGKEGGHCGPGEGRIVVKQL